MEADEAGLRDAVPTLAAGAVVTVAPLSACALRCSEAVAAVGGTEPVTLSAHDADGDDASASSSAALLLGGGGDTGDSVGEALMSAGAAPRREAE